MIKKSSVSLSTMEPNQIVKVTQILGGDNMLTKLNVMGVSVGTKIKKISSTSPNWPMVFEAKGVQVAIGKGIAQKIFVKI